MGNIGTDDAESLVDGLHGLNIELIVVAAQIVSHLPDQNLKDLGLFS